MLKLTRSIISDNNITNNVKLNIKNKLEQGQKNKDIKGILISLGFKEKKDNTYTYLLNTKVDEIRIIMDIILDSKSNNIQKIDLSILDKETQREYIYLSDVDSLQNYNITKEAIIDMKKQLLSLKNKLIANEIIGYKMEIQKLIELASNDYDPTSFKPLDNNIYSNIRDYYLSYYNNIAEDDFLFDYADQIIRSKIKELIGNIKGYEYLLSLVDENFIKFYEDINFVPDKIIDIITNINELDQKITKDFNTYYEWNEFDEFDVDYSKEYYYYPNLKIFFSEGNDGFFLEIDGEEVVGVPFKYKEDINTDLLKRYLEPDIRVGDYVVYRNAPGDERVIYEVIEILPNGKITVQDIIDYDTIVYDNYIYEFSTLYDFVKLLKEKEQIDFEFIIGEYKNNNSIIIENIAIRETNEIYNEILKEKDIIKNRLENDEDEDDY